MVLCNPTTMKTDRPAQQTQNTKLLTDGVNGKPSFEEVATFAYLIWEQKGRSDGHDLDDWLEAEMQLEATRREETVPG